MAAGRRTGARKKRWWWEHRGKDLEPGVGNTEESDTEAGMEASAET